LETCWVRCCLSIFEGHLINDEKIFSAALRDFSFWNGYLIKTPVMQHQKPNFTLLDLARKWISGKITAGEKTEFDKWYDSFDDTSDELVSAETASAMNDRLKREIFAKAGIEMKKTVRLWPRIAAVAAAVATIVFGLWFYEITLSRKAFHDDELVMNDVAPGSNKATLTLASDKVIQLSNVKTGVDIDADSLKYNDGSLVQGDQKNTGAVSVPALGARGLLTASTPRGGTYTVTLPDGTKVWLNAASSLKFPAAFTGLPNRKVELTGEAYFEVSKDKAHPFIVKTTKQEVEVLGTHFNINSYEDEKSTKTTLLEGAVQVSLLGGGPDEGAASRNDVILKPNEQSTLTDSRIKVAKIDVGEVIAWKKGDFIFNDETLESVMRKVSRWYDVEVVYAEAAPKNFTIGGFVSRSKPISAVLELMEKTGNVKFKVLGRRIIVLP
jgi:transmembrane sensor